MVIVIKKKPSPLTAHAHRSLLTARTSPTATFTLSRPESVGGDGREESQRISARAASGSSPEGPSGQIGGGGGISPAADLHPADGAFHGRGAGGDGQGMGASAATRSRSGATATNPAGEGGYIGGAEADFPSDPSSLGRISRAPLVSSATGGVAHGPAGVSQATGDRRQVTGDMRWPARWLVRRDPAEVVLSKVLPVDGSLLLRQEIARVVLFDLEGMVIDARYLKEGESISCADWIEFPGHLVQVFAEAIVDSPDWKIEIAQMRARVSSTPRSEVEDTVGIRFGSFETVAEVRAVMGRPVSPVGDAPVLDRAASGNIEKERHISSDPSGRCHFSSLFAHFWSRSRVSRSVGGDSFGWWPGKIGGDSRSFAQVAASPPNRGSSRPRPSSRSMGDRGGGGGGGRFQGRRGGAPGRGAPGASFGRGAAPNNKPYVWQRDMPDGGGEKDGRPPSRDRWEVAAEKQSGAGKGDGAGSSMAQGAGQRGRQVSPAKSNSGMTDPCFNCNIVGHFAVSCPTIRCSRCKKLGHTREICQAVIPWECSAAMCGFQSPGLGFFFFPDECAGKQSKERASSVIINVLEGNPGFREIELEFNEYFGSGWRCTARTMGPKQFSMRFPNPKEVERTCYFGRRMEMKTFDGVLNVVPWTASAGAKAQMQKAWVKISNIPADKRCEATAAYAGSLVGVSLEIDSATLFKPEFCRVLIGCRDVNLIPESAEGVLGDYFYDFFYEVDSVVVGGQPRDRSAISVDSRQAPSPKRPRIEDSTSVDPGDSSTNDNSGSNQGYRGGRFHSQVLATVSEHDSEEESEEEQELLIEQMAKERMQHGDKTLEVEMESNIQDVEMVEKTKEAGEAASEVELAPAENIPSGSEVIVNDVVSPEKQERSMVIHRGWAPVTPVVLKENVGIHEGTVLDDEMWPLLVKITEVEGDSISPGNASVPYFVQTPESSSPVEINPVEEMQANVELGPRNFAQKMGVIAENAAAISKKRNLEGNNQSNSNVNYFAELSDKEMVVRASLFGVDIPNDSFQCIDLVRNLEVARNDLSSKSDNNIVEKAPFVIQHDLGESTPLHIDWAKNGDSDGEPFITVLSRKEKKKRPRRVVVGSKPMTRSQGEASTSTQLPGRGARNKKTPSRFKC